MSLPRYPEYRPSGVEWLGDVPATWRVQRLKHVSMVAPSNVDKKSYDDELPIRLCNYTDVYYNEAITANIDFMQATASEEQAARFQLQADDIIITKDSEEAGDIAISAYVPETLPGVVCGYHLALIRPREGCDGRYIKRLFDSRYLKSRVAVSANGLTRVGLSQYALDNLDIPFPSLAEQAAIATFLDRETAKIDALIADQERLIALLKEKRQAVISHAVTKGLNPDATMKDSGIEWLGDVPAHWDVAQIKHKARMESGHTPDKKIAAYWENGDIPWVSLNDTGFLKDNEYIAETANQITQAGVDNSSARLLPPGAVVFSRDATIGRCAITTRPMTVSQHFIAWICSEAVIPEYLLQIFRSMLQELDRRATGATVKTIGMPDVRELTMPVPPIAEQRSIVEKIQSSCRALDGLIEEAENAVTLLQERRSALISAAVTGQIDVRQAASGGNK